MTSELVGELCTNEEDSDVDKSGILDTDISLGCTEVSDCGIELSVLAVEV